MNKLEKTILEFLKSWLESDLCEFDEKLNHGQGYEIRMDNTDESFKMVSISFIPEIIQAEQTDSSGCEGTGDYYNELSNIEIVSIMADDIAIDCLKTIKFVRETMIDNFENKLN